MLTHPLVDRLRSLGLTAMADAFLELQAAAAAADLSREDWLGLLLDREATSRENRPRIRRPPRISAAIPGSAPNTFHAALICPDMTCCWPIVEVSPFCALATNRKNVPNSR